MPLTRKQTKELETAPPADAIRTREEGGKSLSYLEGWYLVHEANRIFGVHHWDRITLTTQCVWQGKHDGRPACSYTARVRLCIRVGTESFVREGSGAGHATGLHPGEAHGQALKAAETDATKRALATLGASFGLTLYCGEAKGENPKEDKTNGPSEGHSNAVKMSSTDQMNRSAGKSEYWIFRGPDGGAQGFFTSPILCCSALRRAIDQTKEAAILEALYTQNKRTLARLVAERPDLKNDGDRHYASILSSLFQTRLKALAAANGANAANPAPQGEGPIHYVSGSQSTSIN